MDLSPPGQLLLQSDGGDPECPSRPAKADSSGDRNWKPTNITYQYQTKIVLRQIFVVTTIYETNKYRISRNNGTKVNNYSHCISMEAKEIIIKMMTHFFQPTCLMGAPRCAWFRTLRMLAIPRPKHLLQQTCKGSQGERCISNSIAQSISTTPPWTHSLRPKNLPGSHLVRVCESDNIWNLIYDFPELPSMDVQRWVIFTPQIQGFIHIMPLLL